MQYDLVHLPNGELRIMSSTETMVIVFETTFQPEEKEAAKKCIAVLNEQANLNKEMLDEQQQKQYRSA